MQALRKPLATAGRLSLMLIVAAAVFAGGLGFGGGLTSTRAQTGGEIRGCVNLYTGQLRILSGDGQCTSSERPLNWNQQGPSGLLDIQRVEGRAQVQTDDVIGDRAFVEVNCPAGYNVIGGGAGLTFLVGNDRWFMTASSPRLAGDPGSDDLDGWTAKFETLDGEDAEGQYGFFAEAICALTS